MAPPPCASPHKLLALGSRSLILAAHTRPIYLWAPRTMFEGTSSG